MQESLFRFAVQMRTGRTALGWSQTDLALKAGVARPTIARIESFAMQPKLETAERLRHALRQAGIEFLDYEPDQGFTMVVKGAALRVQFEQINIAGSENGMGNPD
jgi:transcriptional regulator with XRE-family HTH domain